MDFLWEGSGTNELLLVGFIVALVLLAPRIPALGEALGGLFGRRDDGGGDDDRRSGG